jgi:hypothetical protein
MLLTVRAFRVHGGAKLFRWKRRQRAKLDFCRFLRVVG